MQSIAQMAFWLALVLVLIPASLWLVKRAGWTGRTPGALAPAQVLRTVAQTNLGPGQRVVALEVNAGGERTWLILGVTGQTMTTLSQMPAPQAVSVAVEDAAVNRATSALPPVFASLLKRAQAPHAQTSVQKAA